MGTRHVTIELSDASYELLKSELEAGRYASESALLQDALNDFLTEQSFRNGGPAFESWLRDVVLPADDEFLADPGSACTPEQLDASLAEARTRFATEDTRS